MASPVNLAGWSPSPRFGQSWRAVSIRTDAGFCHEVFARVHRLRGRLAGARRGLARAGKALTFQVYDPTYFVSFDFDRNGVTLASAPSGCSLTLVPPKSLDDKESQKLSEAFFSGLSPGADFGIKLAGRAIVACP